MKTPKFSRSLVRLNATGAFLVIAIAANLSADPITTITPDQVAPNATVITFAGLAVFSQPTSVGGVGFVLSNGSGPDVAYDPDRTREFGPAEGTVIQNIESGRIPLNMNFPGQINQLGFDMRTLAGEAVTLTFTSGGKTVESLSMPTLTTGTVLDAPLSFYGFQSTVPFDHVFVDINGPNSGFMEIDNVAFANVPDATKTLPLLGIGVALLLFARWEIASRQRRIDES